MRSSATNKNYQLIRIKLGAHSATPQVGAKMTTIPGMNQAHFPATPLNATIVAYTKNTVIMLIRNEVS